jgi:hypothetical protein
VVVNDFYIFSTCIRPTKADTPLIINTNAVLTGTVALKSFKVIAGWYPQIVELTSDLELSNFTPCNLSNVCELPDTPSF